jgi:hypothetical protein
MNQIINCYTPKLMALARGRKKLEDLTLDGDLMITMNCIVWAIATGIAPREYPPDRDSWRVMINFFKKRPTSLRNAPTGEPTPSPSNTAGELTPSPSNTAVELTPLSSKTAGENPNKTIHVGVLRKINALRSEYASDKTLEYASKPTPAEYASADQLDHALAEYASTDRSEYASDKTQAAHTLPARAAHMLPATTFLLPSREDAALSEPAIAGETTPLLNQQMKQPDNKGICGFAVRRASPQPTTLNDYDQELQDMTVGERIHKMMDYTSALPTSDTLEEEQKQGEIPIMSNELTPCPTRMSSLARTKVPREPPNDDVRRVSDDEAHDPPDSIRRASAREPRDLASAIEPCDPPDLVRRVRANERCDPPDLVR